MRFLQRIWSSPKRSSRLRTWMTRRFNTLFAALARNAVGLRLLHFLFGRKRWFVLMYAQHLRTAGDHVAAHRVLMLGQRTFTRSTTLHLHLAALYNDNADFAAAHTHFRIASITSPGYGMLRRLSFESDRGLFAEGTRSFAGLLEKSDAFFRVRLPMLLRVSVHYPEHHQALFALQQRLRAHWLGALEESSKEIATPIRQSLLARLPDVTFQLTQRARERRISLPANWDALVRRVERDLGWHPRLAELLWRNEAGDDFGALWQGEVVSVSQLPSDKTPVVELFLPSAFWALPWQEKATHATVRVVFVNAMRALFSREDVAVVPRIQHNWRYCEPCIPEAYVISYHTVSSPSSRRLHIQESTLQGRCSFDGAGFAGFASIANDASLIDDFSAHVTPEVCAATCQDLYRQYVERNVSKYAQHRDTTPLPERYVFVPLQVQTDVVAQLAHMDALELLHAVVQHYRETATRVVVKRHPYCASMRVQRALTSLAEQDDIVLSNASVHQLIQNAEAVLTVNSGTGLEALIHGRPVVVVGKCDYAYAAHEVRSADELHELLAQGVAPDMARIQRLLHYYYAQYTLAADDQTAIAQRLSAWLGLDAGDHTAD